MSSHLLMPACFLPPISYFSVLKQQDAPLLVEKFEHYPKQTFRTRAQISTANGILELFVPIHHGRKMHVPMYDIRINYDHNWQRLHWMSLETAYRSSAYFEYYEDDFHALYDHKYEFLLDFNVAQLELLLKCLKLKKDISFTSSYQKVPEGAIDYRTSIHPKRETLMQEVKPYFQTFEDKNGFIPDLSIVDLLFHQGPQSKNFL